MIAILAVIGIGILFGCLYKLDKYHVELVDVTNIMNKLYYDTDIDTFKDTFVKPICINPVLSFKIIFSVWYANFTARYLNTIYLVNIRVHCNSALARYIAFKYHSKGYYIIEREPFLDFYEYITIIPKNLDEIYKNLSVLPRDEDRLDAEGYTLDIR